MRDLFEDEEHSMSRDDINHVKDIKVFTASAKNYMQLIGQDNSDSVPLFADILIDW